MRALILVVLMSVGCKHVAEHTTFGIGGPAPIDPQGDPGAAASAAGGGIAAAVTSSVISRAQGGCYAFCPPGTVCNRANGFCDEVPCRGTCRDDEVCDAASKTCLPRLMQDLRIEGKR